MIFKDTGEICDNFYIVGSNVVPVYLLDGPTPVLFDGGFTALTKYYEHDIGNVLKDRSPPRIFSLPTPILTMWGPSVILNVCGRT